MKGNDPNELQVTLDAVTLTVDTTHQGEVSTCLSLFQGATLWQNLCAQVKAHYS